jgi:flagellin-like protein
MKGISPIVATVVLIAIAVITAGMLAAWQSGWLGGWVESLRESSGRQLRCGNAEVVLENVSYNCNTRCDPNVNHVLNARIRNIGQVGLKIRNLYLVNQSGNRFEYFVNASLPVDGSLDFTNTSLADCFGINHSVSQIILSTDCGMLTSGVQINWINC